MEIQLESLPRELCQRMLASALLVMSLLALFLLNVYSPLSASAAFNTTQLPRPMSLEQMKSQYMELRESHGHFDGKPWNADVDLWSGKKHLIMRALSHWLETEAADKQQVLEVMGQPDTMITAGVEGFDELPEEVKKGEVLIYFWRSRHDYLYFSCREAMPCNANWWHAYE